MAAPVTASLMKILSKLKALSIGQCQIWAFLPLGGFRAGRSITEQIFNLRILGEKYLQHQQNLYYVFIDFKKASDRVWHEALWATMRKYINASIIQPIENLYDTAQSAVLFNGSTGEWFRTTVGVWEGCLLSPTLFYIFLEKIMCVALDDHEGSVSIRGRLITNFPFADDIVVNAAEEEAGVLIDRLDTNTTRYKMDIGPDKTKVMTNNPNGFQREIKIKGQRLEEVKNFKYLGAIISNEGSKPEILSRIAQTTALSRLIWTYRNISLASNVKLTWTLILSIFPYACESWTLTAEIERRIQALEMRCYRRLLNISYKDHVTNEEIRNRIQNAIGVHDDLLTMVKKWKLRWYGHISRSSGMVKTILQGTVKGARRRGRQKKRWEDNIKERTGMVFGDSLRAAEDREGWKGIVAMFVVPQSPPRLRDWDEMRKGSNSKVDSLIWPKFELIRDFMAVVVTCKIDENLIKSEVAIIRTTFSPL